MAIVICPFCETPLEPIQVQGLGGHFRHFRCGACATEIRQPMAAETGKRPEPTSGLDCPECAFGDVHCSRCDDSLCEHHVRTFESYRKYFSEDVANQLIQRGGGRIYCPPCFQNTIERESRVRSAPVKAPRSFNFPIILGLLSLFLIIMIGLRRCDAADSLTGRQVRVYEQKKYAGR
jgi:hypothetical protein